MTEISPGRVIALLAQRRSMLGRAERRALLEACRDAPTRVAHHLESFGVTRECVAALVEEGTRIARRAGAIAGQLPLSDPADRSLRDAVRDGLLDDWGLCGELVDRACGGPPLDEVARAQLARGATVIVSPAADEQGASDLASGLASSIGYAATRTLTLPPVPNGAPRIGRYPVTGRLGAGGMGEVLAVQDASLGREVAAKVIRGEATERVWWKFVLEARITGRLAHPSIVPVYELGRTDEGQLYFTMKRIKGRTLTAVLADTSGSSDDPTGADPTTAKAASGRLLGERLSILQKVCDAVAFAHSQGVIHRDLKPDNVMVGAFGEVVVCDWGLAKVLRDADDPDLAGDALVPVRGEGESVVTLDGDVMGTPAYMPPEQAEGYLELIDERADVYALGAILYQLLCGTPPYIGATAVSVLEQVQRGPPVPPAIRAPAGANVPWELEAVAMKAMARERANRYDSVAALRADLDSFIAGNLLAAASYTPTQRAAKWARRNARTLVPLAVALVSLIGALAYGTVSARRQVRELEKAERTAQSERDQARTERAHAVESYAEARRMGAVHRVHELERAEKQALRWTPSDRTTGSLRDLPTEARLVEARSEIDRWCLEVDGLVRERPAYARALAVGQAEAAAAPPGDAWLSFRADILAELCAGLDRLDAARPHAIARRTSYEALQSEHKGRAAAWAAARLAIAHSPRYGGLELEPQVGLVPLGEHAETGLWEFGVGGSGEMPERTSGSALPIADRTAVVLVLIPGGVYDVGAERRAGRNLDPLAEPSDGPEQAMNLRPYFIARTELTQHQWICLGGTNPSRHAVGLKAGPIVVTPRHPVETVMWDECVELLSRHGLVLPSEAQWEAATRGGRTTPWWTGAEASELARADNIADLFATRYVRGLQLFERWDDGHCVHAPVGSYPKGQNPFGLFDVHGNVREWCRSAFVEMQPLAPFADSNGDVPVAKDVPLRACRGGGWRVDAPHARLSWRNGNAPAYSDDTLGVRPVRPVTGLTVP